jgi:hypothetical protein
MLMISGVFFFYLLLASGVWCETGHAIAEENPVAGDNGGVFLVIKKK